MRIPLTSLLALAFTLCWGLSSALFSPLIRQLKAHKGSSFGYAGGNGYGGYNYGGAYRGSGFGNGYYGGYRPPARGRRMGRTYTDIAKVLNQDVYIGGGRFSPRQPFYPLGG